MKEHVGLCLGSTSSLAGEQRKKDNEKSFICQVKEFELEQEEPKRFSSLEAT